MRRYSWLDDTEFDEVLSLEPGAVRLERLNLGAPFLDTHCSYGLDNVIGSVVKDSARIKDGKGICRILLSKAAGVADTVQKILEGVIRNISVGYWIHKVVKTEATDGTVARWDIVDWEPLEVSAVPIPADPGSQIRSERSNDGSGPSTRACVFITPDSAKAPQSATKETRMANTRKPAAARGGKKTLAELEAENVRLAALLAAKRDEDDDKKDDKEGDEDDDKKSDDERDGDEDDKKDDDAEGDDKRDDGDESDEEDDADDEDGKRAAASKTARAAADAAVKAERERSAHITQIAERAGLPKLGRKHIDKGTTVRAFKNLLLERMLDKQGKEAPIRGVSENEDLTRERGAKAPTSQERQMAEGSSHWRKVAGKVEAAKV